uniref:Protein Lines N-terminal domain-containing protein n=1 Tax=Neogobius melanostomus TaxID=47308 RepID=A0A8C6SUB9_9GOBI
MSGGLPVPEPLAPLEELYHCVLSADCLSLTPAHSANLLRSCLYAQGAGESACECASASELQCVSLTVLEQLLCRLAARRGGPDFHLFAEETWSLLQADVMGALLQQLNSEDLLVSHLSVTCASAAVIYQLHNTGSVNAEWSRWCIQTLRGPLGPPVDACVRSLTEVLRRLLKGAHYELGKKVLVEFDSSLSASCPRWLSADAGGGCDGRGSSISLVVDLLEVLCACRSVCAHGATLSSLCLLGVCSRELLALCSCSKPAVRRRVLLLLKRALVQRAGEDWLGGHQGQSCRDVSLLAHSVLRAAAEGELKGVPLEGMPFFGGTQTVSSGRSVDNVSLRALCLVLLKSMELQCHPDGSVVHAEPVPLALCLQSLWDILPMDSPVPPSGQPRHCCSRVSSVFGEQDDDMMEAAKALLCIFLQHRQQEPAQSTSLLLWACPLGLNPHCQLLLLLRSLSFDHRVLLDFLISTETCFLEYFVRYLRFLRTDPGGFSAACASVCLEQQQPGKDGGYRGCRGAGGAEDTGGAGQGCGVVLVDYSSSGESDTEVMERTGTLKEFNTETPIWRLLSAV